MNQMQRFWFIKTDSQGSSWPHDCKRCRQRQKGAGFPIGTTAAKAGPWNQGPRRDGMMGLATQGLLRCAPFFHWAPLVLVLGLTVSPMNFITPFIYADRLATALSLVSAYLLLAWFATGRLYWLVWATAITVVWGTHASVCGHCLWSWPVGRHGLANTI